MCLRAHNETICILEASLLHTHLRIVVQGGHSTGKTGNLEVDRKDPGNLVNLIFYTGNIVATQGKFCY